MRQVRCLLLVGIMCLGVVICVLLDSFARVGSIWVCAPSICSHSCIPGKQMHMYMKLAS